MTAFVEECRREWKRLGVPDLMADEMATDLEADLAEAEADGVSAAEMLGESDPRRFAASWASERGLVAEKPPKRRRRRWIWVVVGLALAFVFMIVLGLVAAVGVSTQTHASPPQPPQTVRSVVIPNFAGLTACHARTIALESGLKVRRFPHNRCNAVVIAQQPLQGTLLQWPRGAQTTVTLRLSPAGS
jgi:hypothetical protein